MPATSEPIGNLSGEPVYGLAKDTALPVGIRQPDPSYTDDARRAKISGALTLAIVVDAQGDVRDLIELGKPLGFGLDQVAIITVHGWKFKPAEKNGVPIAVSLGVQVSFRLL